VSATDALVLLTLAVVSIVLWLLRARGGITFADLLGRTDLAWPRGVQEEEPTPWHPERLHPRAR
jgi:hypothetical protein